ncbi:MAG: hypothetical protein WAU71_09925, partial [Pyrinomonadaceae bacterium]
MRSRILFSTSIVLFFFVVGFQANCEKKTTTVSSVKVTAVDPALFLKENLLGDVVMEDCQLSDGTKTQCYKISVKGTPGEHKMGPWCPENIKDDKEKGGIWFRDGKVYDVDGKFIANLDEFYSDPKWKLYREDGSINVTKTQAACEAAARPDVAAEYNNYCVECAPGFYANLKTVYLIPINPIYQENISATSGRPPGGGGPPAGERPPRGERPPG